MSATGLRVPRKTVINDMVAGVIMSVATVPGALANGLLAGVNPVYGVYSVIAGTSVAEDQLVEVLPAAPLFD